MSAGPDLSSLSHAQKDALIAALMAQVAFLTARVAELEAKLGLPPKTPDNSSVPPSKGQKPSESSAPKAKAKPHAGAHRPLHPNPTSRREVLARRCQGCGTDVSDAAQSLCESYDRVEIPEIQPDVTRVSLFGGVCPCCAKRFKAEPPAGLEPGSPFGPNLRAFVVYLRSVQGIPLARLSHVLRDLFGLEISEGALVNILSASRKPFAAQTSLIKARLMAGTALASDETGMRVGKANWWLWVFHHRDSAVFVADNHRSKAVVEAFLGDWRPDYWISDRYGGQMGRVESVEAAATGNELRTLVLERLPDRPPALLGVSVRLGPDDALVDEPGVQLAVALDLEPRREEALPHEADLVLDLAFLPARSRRAGNRLNEVVRAHLEEAAIVLAVLADEDRLHRRLHVVVNAAPAGARKNAKPRSWASNTISCVSRG